MKKWGILIGGLIWGFVYGVQAQTDMSSLFSSDNKDIIYANRPKDYTGTPLVFIEGISDKPQPQGWMDEMKIKLFGSMDLPKHEIQKPLPPLQQRNVQQGIKINSFFGGEKTVAFVPHTSDWNFIIQILNDDEITIQEDIQFIKTKETPLLVRDWPKQSLDLLDVRVNGKAIPFQLEEKKESLQLILPQLDTGVHRLHLSYLIKNSGKFSKTEAMIQLPLTNTGWKLPIDSLTGIILFSKEINESNVTFLFGKNKQNIPAAFDVKKDKSGALFFKATHLIPASSPIQLDIDFKFDSFIQKGILRKLIESPSFIIFLISLGVILFYFILNIIEIKITPIEQIMNKKVISNQSIRAFFYRTTEIWIGIFLLWIGTFSILKIMNESFSLFEIQLLFLLPIVFILILDHLLLYPTQEKIKKLRGIK